MHLHVTGNHHHRPARRAHGVGLPESLVVVAVMLVCIAAVLPDLTGMLKLRRLEAAAADWSRVVQAARHWSFNLNHAARLEIQTATPSCLLLHDGVRGACSGCHAPSCRDGAKVLAVTPTVPPGLAVSSSSASLLWNPADRTVTPTGTFRLELPDGRAIHHVVNLAGRLRSCSPDGLVRGMAPC